MITVNALTEDLSILRLHPLVQRVDIHDHTQLLLKARIYFKPDLFLQVYRNDDSRTTSFALVYTTQRVFGIDEVRGKWHIHPLSNPTRHTLLKKPPVSLTQVFQQVEEILAAHDWLL